MKSPGGKPSGQNKHVTPAPNTYTIKEPKTAPCYTFGSRFDERREPMVKKPDGSRFDSQILAKPHLNPKKVDGPGPGSYDLPSSIKQNNRAPGTT